MQSVLMSMNMADISTQAKCAVHPICQGFTYIIDKNICYYTKEGTFNTLENVYGVECWYYDPQYLVPEDRKKQREDVSETDYFCAAMAGAVCSHCVHV